MRKRLVEAIVLAYAQALIDAGLTWRLSPQAQALVSKLIARGLCTGCAV